MPLLRGIPLGLILALAAAATGPGASSSPEFERATALEREGKLKEAVGVLEAGARRLRDERSLKPAVDCDLLRSDLLGRLGDYEGQERAARAASDEATAAGDQRAQARAFNLIGTSHLYRGDYARALPAFRKSLELHELLGESESVVYRHNNIGGIHFFEGRYSEALEAYRAAQKVLDSHSAAPWRAEAQRFTDVNLAALYQRIGRDQPALDIYRKLVHETSQLPANEEARLLANAGALYRRLGDPYKARDSYARALALFRTAGDLDGQLGVMKNLAIVQALDFKDVAAAERGFLEVLSSAKRTGNRREELQARLYLAETRFRAGRVSEAASDWSVARAASAVIGAPEEEWKSIYGLGRAAASRGDAAQAASLLDDAIARIEALRTEVRETPLRLQFLGDKRDVYDARIRLMLSEPSPSAAEVLRLMESAKARAYRDTKKIAAEPLAILQSRLAPGAALANVWASRDSVTVLWVTRSSTRFDTTPARVPKFAPGPIPPHLAHVVVVPDPSLLTPPWETLDADGRPLVERVSVSYLPSAYALQPEDSMPAMALPWRNTLLAFADPGIANDPLSLGTSLLRPLPGARAEIRAVNSLLAGRSLLLEGPGATSQRLRDESVRWPVIHLALHAVADSIDARRSRLLFADGALESNSVQALRLAPGSLVVLAACDTERGQQLVGEGVQSLSRAFLTAGASAVVAAEWPVDDGATRRFMAKFYRALADGETAAAGLRRAKLESIREGIPQRVWAAFVLSGNHMRRIPTGPGFPLLLLIAAGVLAVAAVLLSWRSFPKPPAPAEPPARPPSP